MYQIKISDETLCRKDINLSFKEKLFVSKELNSANVDYIVIPEIKNLKEDALFIKSVSPYLKNTKISLLASSSVESVKTACEVIKEIDNAVINVALPVSPVNMEYSYHMKAQKMLSFIESILETIKSYSCKFVFTALDFTRAESDFISSVISLISKYEPEYITFSDSASLLMPNDFISYIKSITDKTDINVGVSCVNSNYLACSLSAESAVNGVKVISTSVGGDITSLEEFGTLLRNIGNNYKISSGLNYIQLGNAISHIENVFNTQKDDIVGRAVALDIDSPVRLDSKDTKEDILSAVKKLGYDLSVEDENAVYEEFKKQVKDNSIGIKELDAIVANSAAQVPQTYKLLGFNVNCSDAYSSSAQIKLMKDSKELSGISSGNGPVEAAFLAINKITGLHYELDDFQIKPVDVGEKAIGNTIVKLRSENKVYSGSGISTDIIGASINAYINALNKIVYEEG